MTRKQRERLRALIAQKKETVRKRYSERYGGLADLSVKIVGDTADEAVREDALDIQFSLEEADLDELRRLDAAERRIDQEGFGICQSCGDEIDPKRLLVVPETTLCYACAVDAGRQNPEAFVHRVDPIESILHR